MPYSSSGRMSRAARVTDVLFASGGALMITGAALFYAGSREIELGGSQLALTAFSAAVIALVLISLERRSTNRNLQLTTIPSVSGFQPEARSATVARAFAAPSIAASVLIVSGWSAEASVGLGALFPLVGLGRVLTARHVAERQRELDGTYVSVREARGGQRFVLLDRLHQM